MHNFSVLCRHFYASCYLPISHFQHGELVCSAGFPDGLPPYQAAARALLTVSHAPAAYSAPDTGLYGLVRVKEEDSFFIVGPAYSGSVLDEMIHAYMSINAIPDRQTEEVAQFLHSIPQYSYNRFLNVLLFLHFVINDEDLAITEQFQVSDLSYQQEIAARHVSSSYLARDESQQHGTYFFERQMLEYIRQGQPEQMRKFLLDTVMARLW